MTSVNWPVLGRGGGRGVWDEKDRCPLVTLLNFQYLLQHLLADSWKRGGGGGVGGERQMSPGDIIKFPVFTTTSIGRFLEERGGGGCGRRKTDVPW